MAHEIITELPPDTHLKIRSLMAGLEKFGITHVGHGVIVKGLIPSATYSHPEWAHKYKAEKLYDIDPLRRYALSTPFQIICWDNISIESKEEMHGFELRKKVCSVNRGVLISLNSSICLETFVFGSDYRKFSFSYSYIKNKSEISHIMKEIGNAHKILYPLIKHPTNSER